MYVVAVEASEAAETDEVNAADEVSKVTTKDFGVIQIQNFSIILMF